MFYKATTVPIIEAWEVSFNGYNTGEFRVKKLIVPRK